MLLSFFCEKTIMKIKGTSVKSITDFILKKFPEQYKEWINALPEGSKKIFTDLIRVNEWYPIMEGLTIPLHTTAEILYNNDRKKAAWEMGRFSAESVLTGIYKIYVKLGSPSHIIERAGRIMSAIFEPSDLKVTKNSSTSLTVHILLFPEPDESIDYNIAGWMERALEISGCKEIKINISKSLAKNDNLTEFNISWF